MGPDLNRSHDNLWFTLLFKRPGWYRTTGAGDRAPYWALFERAMTGRLRATPATLARLARAGLDTSIRGHDHLGRGRGLWPLYRVRSMLRDGRRRPAREAPWGWKEPNTHLFVEEAADHFGPGFRYVHLVRNGLDMAFSSNRAQLFNWGFLFGLESDRSVPPSEFPRLQLRFWVRANRRAVTRGRDRLGERFLKITFERLCARPREEVERLLSWLGVDGRAEQRAGELARLVDPPPSLGRHRNRDLAGFPAEDLDGVRELGYRVPA